MNVVAHEQMGVDGDRVGSHDLAPGLVTVLTVDIAHEDCATIHTTRGDVKRNAWKVESRLAWHAASVAAPVASCSRVQPRHLAGVPSKWGSVNYLRPLLKHAL